MTKNIRIISLLSLAVLALSVSACNTVDGAGQDIEHAGEAVQDAAD